MLLKLSKAFSIVSKISQTPVLELLFLIKLQDSACNSVKERDPGLGVFCEFCEIFKNNFFSEHLHSTGSEYAELFRNNLMIGKLSE